MCFACMCACSVLQLCPILCDPKEPLSMGFCRQRYWSGLPFPPSWDLPNPGSELTFSVSPILAGRFFSTEPPGDSP